MGSLTWPRGLKLEFILKLEIKGNDWLLYFEFETVLKFYNLEAYLHTESRKVDECSGKINRTLDSCTCMFKRMTLCFYDMYQNLLNYEFRNCAVTCDFQQCGILTSVDSDEHVQPPFKLRKLI